MTATTQDARRVGGRIGSWLSNAVFVADGYVWATYGILWALAAYAGFVALMFAIYGAVAYSKDQKR